MAATERPKIIAAAYIQRPYSNPCVLETPITCKNKGINMDLFDYLMSIMGYDYKVVPADGNISGYNVSGNITGILGQIARKEVDMSATLAAVHSGRLGIIDFSAPVTYIDYGFLIRKPKLSISGPSLFNFLLSPFTRTVWIYIFALTFGAVAVNILGQIAWYSYFSTTKNSSALKKHAVFRPFANFVESSFFAVYRSIVNQGESVAETTTFKAQRLFSCLWALSLFIVVLIYHGQLTGTLLVGSPEKPPFTTIKQLADLIYDQKYTFVTIQHRSIFVPLAKTAGNKANPTEKIRIAMNWNPPIYANGTHHLADLIINSSRNLVYYASYYSVQDIGGLSCDVRAVRVEDSRTLWLGFMSRKHSGLAEKLSLAFYRRDTSVHSYFDILYKKYQKQPLLCPNYHTTRGVKDDYASLTIETFLGAIGTLLIGAAVALCVFATEGFVALIVSQMRRRVFRKVIEKECINAVSLTALPLRHGTHRLCLARN